MHNIVIGDLTFELRHSEKRRTIGITIGRMGELILSAPPDCPQTSIEHAVQKKSGWIYRKLAQKEMLFKAPQDKVFVDGEGFYYLGRSYRLRLVLAIENCTSPLALSNERFLLRQDELERGEEHFTNCTAVGIVHSRGRVREPGAGKPGPASALAPLPSRVRARGERARRGAPHEMLLSPAGTRRRCWPQGRFPFPILKATSHHGRATNGGGWGRLKPSPLFATFVVDNTVARGPHHLSLITTQAAQIAPGVHVKC